MRRMWQPDHGEAVRLAGLEHEVPELHGVVARIAAVDLEPDLRRVAGARDHHVHALELVVAAEVVRNLENAVAEQVDKNVPRLRALDLHRADVRLTDPHVEAGVVGDTHRPQEHIAVGDRDPEVILIQPQQDGVVDDAAVRGGDEHVLALANGALVQVARDEHVRQRERVGPGDLHLPLDPDVPERDTVQKLPVLRHRVAVVTRVVHVVVEAVHVHAVAARRVEVRRLPDPRVQQDLRVLDDLRHCSCLLFLSPDSRRRSSAR